MKYAVMALSGGMDSTGLLLRLLADGYDVTCISFDYGQKHRVELERAKDNIDYLCKNNLPVRQEFVDLTSAMSIFYSALISTDIAIPEGHYEKEQMKATVVPNRNAIFASIIYGYALSQAIKNETSVEIALGVHSGDHAIYPDCRPEFYDAISEAFAIGNWESERVSFLLPYIDGDKETILRDALNACAKLELDFDTVFRNTNTSYDPDEMGRSSGKSGADIERILAFYAIGRKDPITYTKPWDIVLKNALNEQLRYRVMKENHTEPPFTGAYYNHFEDGRYFCSECNTALFDSSDKFDSGCGWPAFSSELEEANIEQRSDLSHGMERIEVRCSGCDSHLGHLFHELKGTRYCINSICLEFRSNER